jgi:YegS/Rv2252/BmrU family lipid kinase
MRIQVVVNPASGQPEPVLSILNDAFGPEGIDWSVAVTHGAGDGYRQALKAAEEGFDVIGVYGGDGSVAEVASAIARHGGPPIAILPGGTGNALAEDLGIPRSLADAAHMLAIGDCEIRSVDMGRIDDGWFVLRATMGFEASVVNAASRDLKGRFGWLAYAFGGLQALGSPPVAHYRIDIDDQHVEAEGLACIVANSASTGVLGVRIADGVDVSDGKLDVIVVDNASLTQLAGTVADVAQGYEPRGVSHWSGSRIRVESHPAQPVLADGEAIGDTPVEAQVVSQAIHVVVPRQHPVVGR